MKWHTQQVPFCFVTHFSVILMEIKDKRQFKTNEEYGFNPQMQAFYNKYNH